MLKGDWPPKSWPPEDRHTILAAEYKNSVPGPYQYNAYDTKTRISLAILRVCSQIYSESHHLPYSSNTFVFPIFYNCCYGFRSFMGQFNLEAVREVIFRVISARPKPPSNTELRDTMERVVRNMPNLDCMRLAIFLEGRRGLSLDDKKLKLQPTLDGLRPLVSLPLKTLTVVMRDKDLEEFAQAQLALCSENRVSTDPSRSR